MTNQEGTPEETLAPEKLSEPIVEHSSSAVTPIEQGVLKVDLIETEEAVHDFDLEIVPEGQPSGADVVVEAHSEEPESVEATSVYEQLMSIDLTESRVAETDDELDAPQSFEAFVATQPEVSEEISIAELHEAASQELPLEETIVLLVRYLKNELDPQGSSEEILSLDIAISELQDALQTLTNENSQEQITRLTPEVTQKLLVVLRELGYDQPGDVLIDFVQAFKLAFLIEALEYICYLHNTDDNQGVTSRSVAVATENDTLYSKLGGLFLRLVTQNAV